MILITKIKIDYYRSFNSIIVKDLKDLNIFSGKNDIGKSNILKALDTFFNKNKINFSEDYNKARLTEVRESIKGKQFIKITIDFKNPGTYKTLPTEFNVTKSWDKDGVLIENFKDNFETLVNSKKLKKENLPKARTSLTRLLNKIRFTYIPAIRDEEFFSFLINKLQETIFEVEERRKNETFQGQITNFNETVGALTQKLNTEFQNVSGIESNLSFPNNISEIFQRLVIDTNSGTHKIPLRLRGDGIRLRYIPTILNYISEHSKFYEIWGFDEPENSCEYSLSKSIAEQFNKEYSKKAQIFVASHSFHFISIESSNTSKYRIYRKDGELNSEIIKLDERNKNLLSNELGILGINDELAKLYNSLSAEMLVIEKTKADLESTKKPYLIFEGKTDNKLFEIAYENLYQKKIEEDFFICEHMTNDSGSSIGSGANFINQFMCNHVAKLPTNNIIIGIFDFDETGVNEIFALKRLFTKVDKEEHNYLLYNHKIKKNVFIMTLVTPDHRTDFTHKTNAKYCYLSTELLLEDVIIPTANRKYPTQFPTPVYNFNGKKDHFANNIDSYKNSINFDGFKPTFEVVLSLISKKNTEY